MREPECLVVMYHYVRDMHNTAFPDVKGLTLDRFSKQIKYLHKNYSIITLKSYLEYLEGGPQIPEKSCILTFDDGFKDHYLNAYPLLKDMGVTGVFFPILSTITESKVSSVHKVHFLLAKIGPERLAEEINCALRDNYPETYELHKIEGDAKQDKKYVYDTPLVTNIKVSMSKLDLKIKEDILSGIFEKTVGPEEEFCKELYLNWEDIKEMQKNGMEFGTHSIQHSRLTSLSREDLLDELKVPKDIIENEIKIDVFSISYPYGDYDDDMIPLLKSLGYRCAITTEEGINIGRDFNPFKIRRFDTNEIYPNKG